VLSPVVVLFPVVVLSVSLAALQEARLSAAVSDKEVSTSARDREAFLTSGLSKNDDLRL